MGTEKSVPEPCGGGRNDHPCLRTLYLGRRIAPSPSGVPTRETRWPVATHVGQRKRYPRVDESGFRHPVAMTAVAVVGIALNAGAWFMVVPLAPAAGVLLLAVPVVVGSAARVPAGGRGPPAPP